CSPVCTSGRASGALFPVRDCRGLAGGGGAWEAGGGSVWDTGPWSPGGRSGGCHGRGGARGGRARENAHNFYKIFTPSLQNRYDLPWRAPYTFRCVAPTQRILGLAGGVLWGKNPPPAPP